MFADWMSSPFTTWMVARPPVGLSVHAGSSVTSETSSCCAEPPPPPACCTPLTVYLPLASTLTFHVDCAASAAEPCTCAACPVYMTLVGVAVTLVELTNTVEREPTSTLVYVDESEAAVADVHMPVTSMVPVAAPPSGSGQSAPSVMVTSPEQGNVEQALTTCAQLSVLLIAFIAITVEWPSDAAAPMATSIGLRSTSPPVLMLGMQPPSESARHGTKSVRLVIGPSCALRRAVAGNIARRGSRARSSPRCGVRRVARVARRRRR